MTLGKRLSQELKYFRENHHFTQQQLADMLGMSRQTIIRWESRGADSATLEEIQRIAGQLGLPIAGMLGLDRHAEVRKYELADDIVAIKAQLWRIEQSVSVAVDRSTKTDTAAGPTKEKAQRDLPVDRIQLRDDILDILALGDARMIETLSGTVKILRPSLEKLKNRSRSGRGSSG